MNFNFDLKNLFKRKPKEPGAEQSSGRKFRVRNLKNHIDLILLAILALIFLAVAWVIVGEVRKIKGFGTDSNAVLNQLVQVNQTKFLELQQRLEDNEHFVPQPVPKAAVFTAPPKPDK